MSSIIRRYIDCTAPMSPAATSNNRVADLEAQVKLVQAQVALLSADVTALRAEITRPAADGNAVTKRNASPAAEKQRAYRARIKARKEVGNDRT